MLPTYSGVLRGNRIDWTGEAPREAAPGQAVPVHVTLLEPLKPPADQGRRMAEALERLAASGPIEGISDPARWQREVRRDRPLPGRDE